MNEKYKEINTLKDVFKATKQDEKKFPKFKEVRLKDRKYMRGAYLISLINDAINGKWKPDYSNSNQPKYYCWFYWDKKQSAFVFSYTADDWTSTHATGGARLSFETREQAEHFGRKFIGVINDFLKK